MSIHKSLRSGSGLTRARNVLTRAERYERLIKEGKVAEGDPVTGLPKTRVFTGLKKGKGKKKKKEEEEGEDKKAKK